MRGQADTYEVEIKKSALEAYALKEAECQMMRAIRDMDVDAASVKPDGFGGFKVKMYLKRRTKENNAPKPGDTDRDGVVGGFGG